MFVTTTPGALEAAAAMVTAIGGQAIAANMTAGAVHAATLPPGAEEVSMFSAMTHQQAGVQFQASQAYGQALLQDLAVAMGIAGVSYTATDVAGGMLAL